ncbi:hypothetical protein ACV17F_005113 [Vibrio harveyi]
MNYQENEELWGGVLKFYTYFFIVFDVILIIYNEYSFITYVSILGVILGILTFKKLLSDGKYYYLLLYILPLSFFGLSYLSDQANGSLTSSDFVIAAYLSAFSVLAPVVSSSISVPVILCIRANKSN